MPPFAHRRHRGLGDPALRQQHCKHLVAKQLLPPNSTTRPQDRNVGLLNAENCARMYIFEAATLDDALNLPGDRL